MDTTQLCAYIRLKTAGQKLEAVTCSICSAAHAQAFYRSASAASSPNWATAVPLWRRNKKNTHTHTVRCARDGSIIIVLCFCLAFMDLCAHTQLYLKCQHGRSISSASPGSLDRWNYKLFPRWAVIAGEDSICCFFFPKRTQLEERRPLILDSRLCIVSSD